jgi:hypothetical protein
MNNWICKDNYNFKLYPEIGTWGCYNNDGHYTSPMEGINIINILLILAIIVFAFIVYRERCNNRIKNISKN